MATEPRPPRSEIEQLRERVRTLEEVLALLVPTIGPFPLRPDDEFFARYRDIIFIGIGARRESDEEVSVPGYEHLVLRNHPWRRQLHLRGRNITARQLVGAMLANKWSPEQTGDEFDVTPEAVTEAARYVKRNADLLRFEAAFERFLASKEGGRRATPAVPR